MPQAASHPASGDTTADLGCGLTTGDAGLQSTADVMLEASAGACAHAQSLQPGVDETTTAAVDACASALSLQAAADAMLEALVDACVDAPSLQSGVSSEAPAATAPPGASSTAAATCLPEAAVVAADLSGSPVAGSTVAERQDTPQQHVEDAAQWQAGCLHGEPSNAACHSGVMVKSATAHPGGCVSGSGTCDGSAVVAMSDFGGVDAPGSRGCPQLPSRGAAVASREGEAGRQFSQDLEELRRFWVPEYSSSCSVSVTGSGVGGASMHGGEPTGKDGRCAVHGQTGTADTRGVPEVEGRAEKACEDEGSVREAGLHAVVGVDAARGTCCAGAQREEGSDPGEVSAKGSMALDVAARDGDAGGEVADRWAEDGLQGRSAGVQFTAVQPLDGGGGVGGGRPDREAAVECDSGLVAGVKNVSSAAGLRRHIDQSCSLLGDACMSELALDSGGAAAGSSRGTGVKL